jgi:hypothetical protein
MNIKHVVLGATMMTGVGTVALAQDFALETEGEVTFGFNDTIQDGSYLIGEVEVSAGQTFASGFGWAVTYELEGENFGWGADVDYDDAILLELISPIGTLAYGDMNKDGASEEFYNDLDGMALDVVRYKDGYPSLRWSGSIGANISYAISTRDVNNDDDEDVSIGIGYETDRVEFGVSWDNGSTTQDESWAATGVLHNTVGTTELAYTVSYIESEGESALGLSVEAEFDMGLTVEAAYAFNDVAGAEDGYALSVEYETGALTAEAEYTFDGEEVEYEVAVSYAIDSFAPTGTTLYAGYTFEEGSAEDTGYYFGAGFGISDNAILGIAYSETDEGGDLEVLPGWSTMLTLTF